MNMLWPQGPKPQALLILTSTSMLLASACVVNAPAAADLDGGVVTFSEGQLALDEDRVPVVDDCAEGEIVQRTATGWACVSAPASDGITAVTAGGGLTGGGTSGDVTLAVVFGAAADEAASGASVALLDTRLREVEDEAVLVDATLCGEGEVIGFVAGGFMCTATGAGTGDVTALTAGTGLLGGGIEGDLSLSVDEASVPVLAACDDGQVVMRAAGAWACAAPTDTDTLAGLNCGNNQVAQFDGNGWVCTALTNTDTLAGLSCANNQVAQYDGSDWGCTTLGAQGGGAFVVSGNDASFNGGNVGIGTNAPTVRLHVIENGNNTPAMIVEGGGDIFTAVERVNGNVVGRISFATPGGDAGMVWRRADPDGSFPDANRVDFNHRIDRFLISYNTDGSDPALLLKENGTVGINTLDPNENFALDVDGDVQVDGNLRVDGAGVSLEVVERFGGAVVGRISFATPGANSGMIWERAEPDGSFPAENRVDFNHQADRFYISYSDHGTTPALLLEENGTVGINLPDADDAFALDVGGPTQNTTGVWSVASDRRLKKEVAPIRSALATVEKLKGVSFRWRENERDAAQGRVMGFIAQDVAEVLPQWVSPAADGKLHLEKIGVEALLVEAIKDQQRQVRALDQENRDLKTRLERLEKLVLAR